MAHQKYGDGYLTATATSQPDGTIRVLLTWPEFGKGEMQMGRIDAGILIKELLGALPEAQIREICDLALAELDKNGSV